MTYFLYAKEQYRQAIAADSDGSQTCLPAGVPEDHSCGYRRRSASAAGQRLLLLQNERRTRSSDCRAPSEATGGIAAIVGGNGLSQRTAMCLRTDDSRKRTGARARRLFSRNALHRTSQGGGGTRKAGRAALYGALGVDRGTVPRDGR